MKWHFSYLFAVLITIWQTQAKPLIENPTFSDIDLFAEDSEQNEVYIKTPLRTKRALKVVDNNHIYDSGNAGSISKVYPRTTSSSSSDSDDRYGDRNNFGFINNRGFKNVHHFHDHSIHNEPELNPMFFAAQQHIYSPTSSFTYSDFYNSPNQHKIEKPLIKRPTNPSSPPPRAHYNYLSGFQNYLTPLQFGIHVQIPFGVYSASPLAVEPPGFGYQHFRGRPGFNYGPPPFRSTSSPAHFPPSTGKPIYKIPDANGFESKQEMFVPSSTPAPKIVSSTPRATTTTTEPTYDIDVRIGNR